MERKKVKEKKGSFLFLGGTIGTTSVQTHLFVSKAALTLIGIDAGVGILPVGGMNPDTKAELKRIMGKIGLL
jgi:hypothetical protein